METVNNLASAASRAIWGDGANETKAQEPLSGQKGDVGKGEPYDKGNDERTTETPDTSAPTSTSKTTETSHTSDLTDTSKTTETSDTSAPTTTPQPTGAPGNTPATGAIRSEHETSKTGVTSAHEPTSGFSSDKPSSSNDTSSSGPNPSVGDDPSSAQQSTPKQQGADRPTDEPSSDEHDRIAETKKEAEEAAKVDTSGPGPKSLEEKARESGGNISSSAKNGDEEDGPQKESHGEGTGEKYVKSSGMVADGGDFDAANPGAGKEADRLLEEKGIHHEPGLPKDTSASSSKDDVADSKAGKPSLSEKIKAKLHIKDKSEKE